MPGDLKQLQNSPGDVAFLQKTQEQLAAGRHAAALAGYRNLTTRFPLVAELWFEMGNAASGELNFELATQAYRKATALAERNTSLLLLIGRQYQNLRQSDDAMDCFEQAVASDPTSADARINLAMWYEKERQLVKASVEVEAILAQHPKDDQARYFRALVLHREKRNSEAETVLRDLIKDEPQYPYVKYASRHLLGVVLDELGQYAEAMRSLLDAKARIRQLADVASLEREYDEATAQRRRLLASLTPEMVKSWQDEGAADSQFRVAFLGGHPRSGTTLLEQILDAHPDVLAFDEPVAFNLEIATTLALRPGSGESQARTLHSLQAKRLELVRERYLKNLLHEVGGETIKKVLLDKNPSLTVSLPHWLRVFPRLKVVIALRDPRDVVISSFFLNAVLNATNMNFLSLARTAKHYSDLMDAWLRMRDLGGFEWREIRYEDVVENLASEGRKATEFLALDWHDDQARFYETARRKFLFAPTYHEVRQPVYRRGIGRWAHYAEALEPILPKLAHYCRAFGYPD
jgi:tetratricopeptide (TPR) repeat protein